MLRELLSCRRGSPGRARVVLAAVLAGCLAAPLAGAAPAAAVPAAGDQRCHRGAPGAGDPFFPLAGNGGYDVTHYGLTVRYSSATRAIAATATLTARASARLCRFDLDLVGLTVHAVSVNGSPAAFSRHGQELIVRPAAMLPRGERFTTVVSYSGVPRARRDADGSLDGWIEMGDGAFVAGEPQGSPTWYPCNDTPRDKATYDVHATVPARLTAVGNGVLVRQRTADGVSSFSWRMAQPMATYLATLTIGRFAVTRGRTSSGLPYFDAVDPRARGAQAAIAPLPAILSYYAKAFGPYPFDAAGAIVDRARRVGYALETQSRPLFDEPPDASTLAHEIAHQWFGDSVTLRTWPEIWLNEGFAEWAAWLWLEHAGGLGATQRFWRLYSTPAGDSQFWNPPPGAVRAPKHLFAGSVYDRGAMTLQALRMRIGPAPFAEVLRRWAGGHRYAVGTIAQFQALAERVSGRSLAHFFDVWLRTPGKPSAW